MLFLHTLLVEVSHWLLKSLLKISQVEISMCCGGWVGEVPVGFSVYHRLRPVPRTLLFVSFFVRAGWTLS